LDDSEEKRSQISKKPKGFGGEDPKSPEEPLVTASEGVEEKQELGLRGGHSTPLYIQELRYPDMSGT
jgi:hypothetical protein